MVKYYDMINTYRMPSISVEDSNEQRCKCDNRILGYDVNFDDVDTRVYKKGMSDEQSLF